MRKTRCFFVGTAVCAVMFLVLMHLGTISVRKLRAPFIESEEDPDRTRSADAGGAKALNRLRSRDEEEDLDELPPTTTGLLTEGKVPGQEQVTPPVFVPERAFDTSKVEKRDFSSKKKPSSSSKKNSESSGSYPSWWTQGWERSAVFGLQDEFVGDKPLFPACIPESQKTWTGYGFVEPQNYIKGVKNPCWWDNPKTEKGLKCVPYFYLAGVAKGGTTDLSKRLRQHPDIAEGTMKEYHWWDRDRYGFYDEEDPESVKMESGVTFRDYATKVTGRDAFPMQNQIWSSGTCSKIVGDFSPSYLWDPHNWYVLDGNQGCSEPRVIIGQHMHHVFPDTKIILTFRHPTSRLYSRFVSRISRVAELRGSTPKDFHKLVVRGVELYKKCFAQFSIRHCAYNYTLYKEAITRLVEGMYPVFFGDWLRVYSRRQMLLLRYEDYGGHEQERINEVLQFLGLRNITDKEMEDLMGFHPVNAGTKEYAKYGLMLDETKQVLDDFYQPFITKFAEQTQEERFLWKDVAH